jgi:hypothetical protein
MHASCRSGHGALPAGGGHDWYRWGTTGCGAFGQDRQVPGGDPAVPEPQQLVVGQRPPGQEGPDDRSQVVGPFRGQAREPERLHQRPDEQRVLPDAVNLAEQQQAGVVQ